MNSDMNNALQYHLDHRGITTITLNRPELHNAFDDSVIEAMLDTLAIIQREPRARVLVLRGAGKSFSAGADLAWMRRMAGYDFDTNVNDAGRMADMFNALYALPLPTIAVVQGAAFGGGVGLVAACDFSIGVSSATFCLSEVALGLVPAVISPFVIEAMGLKAFKRYAMSGQRFNGIEAHRLGLLSDVVEQADLDAALSRFVDGLLNNGPEAMATVKTLATQVSPLAVGEATKQLTSHLIAELRGSEEGREGIGAFLEKRSAAWRFKS